MKPGRPIAAAGIVLALSLSLSGISTAQQAPLEDCLGRDVTIQGRGAIIGTPGRDVIAGGPGRDTIRGGGGRDIICGAFGQDRIVGGEGPDILSGGVGRDLVVGDGATWTDKRAVGGAGDTLYGNSSADVLIGDAFSSRGGVATNEGGRDTIIGNDGSYDGRYTDGDLLIGGSVSRTGRIVGRDGTDEIRGAIGPDLIIGDNAKLRGGPHPTGVGSGDLLSGGSADDSLVGGDEDDDCFGRNGRDSFDSCETRKLSCPEGASDGVRPEELLGARVERARNIIERFDDGCTLRVVERDGRPLVVTDDFRPTRINVAVRNERITQIRGLG